MLLIIIIGLSLEKSLYILYYDSVVIEDKGQFAGTIFEKEYITVFFINLDIITPNNSFDK